MSEVVEIDGDSIYVIDRRVESRAVDQPHLYETIDWLALAKQKRALVGMIWDDEASPLWGLVNLIDTIQDDAEAHEYPVVYGYDRAEWEKDNADQS